VVGNSHKQVLAELALKSAAQVAGRGALGGGTEPCLPTPDEQSSVGSSNRGLKLIPVSFLTNHQGRTANDTSENGQRRTENEFSSANDQRPTTTSQSREPGAESPIFVSDIFAHTELLAAPVFDAPNERTRPNLKVQDGCDNRCSFCVIPYVRGQSRSLKPESVIREVQQLVEAGYREVVISGINLGRWGRDLPGSGLQVPGFGQPTTLQASRSSAVLSHTLGSHAVRSFAGTPVLTDLGGHDFSRADNDGLEVAALAAEGPSFEENRTSLANSQRPTTNDDSENGEPRRGNPVISANGRRLVDLIRSILDQTNLHKLRISSVEPMDWTDELIALVANSPRIAKHAHVPMQSGSDRILRAMHRKYRPWHYREKILKIRAAMPNAAIGADVMVGFPGETDADFEETRLMIEELPFTYLHVFTYSARPDTPAATLPNQVSVRVARARNRILRDLASEKKLAFMQSFLGKTIHAITLNVFDGEYTEALTDNYLKLRLAGKHEANRWVEASVEDVIAGALVSREIACFR
jgi:tRNA A37 methylthiotransferase MiaB